MPSFGNAFNIAKERSVICSVLLLLFFSGVMFTVLRSLSKSFRCSCHASPGRMPVSFSNCKKHAVFLPMPAISAFTSASVGMKGSLFIRL